MRNPQIIVLTAALTIVTATAFSLSAAAAPGPIAAPLVKEMPTLDGKLDEPCWLAGEPFGDFVSTRRDMQAIDVTDKGAAVTQQTTAVVVRTESHLLIAVRCDEANMDSLVAEVTSRDGNVFNDDCIEVFLDPMAGGRQYYQIGINALGTVSDLFGVAGSASDWTWDSGAQVGVRREPSGWFAEIAIPFEALGGTPAKGDAWGFNIGRERQAGDREISSWAGVIGGLAQPEAFGRIQFDTAGDDSLRIVGLSRGWASAKGTLTLRNEFRMAFTNRAGVDRTVTLRVSTSEPPLTATVSAGATKTLALAYGVPDRIGAPIEFTVLDEAGQTLYQSRAAVQPDSFPRVWDVEQPLFAELLSDTPPGPRRDGAMLWVHDLNAGNLSPFAVQHGVEWTRDGTFAMMAEHGFLPLGNAGMMKPPSTDLIGGVTKHNHKAILIGNRRSHAPGVPLYEPEGRRATPFALDPANFAVFLRGIRETLEAYPGRIWGVFYADEFQEHQAKVGVHLLAERTDYDYMRRVDDEVREKYGFGKYGMPTSEDDPNPYRWIAYRRWMNDRVAEMAAEFNATVRAVDPEIRTISMDPIARMHPYDWSRLAPHFDIVTHQLYPSRRPDRPRFLTVTKMMADLTGKPVWPVPHVEHYAACFTPDEVRELMSQVFRAGGQGFHFYLSDVRGARSGRGQFTERYGAPRRWRQILDILDRSRTMNELDMPEPDCAVLFSNDAQMGIAGPRITSGGRTPSEAYVSFMSLLARAGAWCRFVDDDMLLRGTSLDGYKAVFVPRAEYQRAAVIGELAAYAERGGTLVVMDPRAFRRDIDGSDPKKARERVLGADSKSAAKETVRFTPLTDIEDDVPAWRPARTVEKGRGEVLAAYADGAPAVVSRSLGKGTVVVFGFDFLNDSVTANETCWEVMRQLTARLGLEMDRDIWRFQFPRPEAGLDPPAPTDRCLTANNVVWIENDALLLHNAPRDGAYRYVTPPGAVEDQAQGNAWISFAEGDLTDRPEAASVASSRKERLNWCVGWKDDTPVEVVFDLREPRALTRAAFWFERFVPAITVEGSNDGESWFELGAVPARTGEKFDVMEAQAPLTSGMPCRYVRTRFTREAGQTDDMVLAEVELWGVPAK